MISKIRLIEIFILWNMYHPVFCRRRIIIDRYEILRPHPGLTKCAVGYSGQNNIFALTVSQTTDKCEGWTHMSPQNQSQGDGYAVKIHFEHRFEPVHKLYEETYIISMLPRGYDTRVHYNIYISIDEMTMDLSMTNVQMFLADGLLKTFYGYTIGSSSLETVPFSVIFSNGSSYCFFQGRTLTEDRTNRTITFQKYQMYKMSFILHTFSIKVMVNNEEQCSQSLHRSLESNFDTLKYIYFLNMGGAINFHKVDFEADAKKGNE